MADALLPGNATAFETAESETSARMLDVPSADIRLMRRAATIPARFLPYLAWERSVDVWDPQWSDAQKRAVIAASFEVHQHKGTRHALDLALASLGVALTTQEWFEYGGGAYRFKMIVDLDTIDVYTARQHASIVRVAFSAKNTRSYLEEILIRRPGTPGPVYVAAAVRLRMRIRTTYDLFSAMRAQSRLYIGAAVFTRIRTRVQ